MASFLWLDGLVWLRNLQCAARRRRSHISAEGRWATESLESRVLLSAMGSLGTPSRGLGTNTEWPEDKEEDQADTPVEVVGAFLTSGGIGDKRNDDYTDVIQGFLDTCAFASSLSAAARTPLPLASRISILTTIGKTVTYQVALYSQNSQGQWVSRNQQVSITGGLDEKDLRPGDGNEIWPAIFQRAYLDLCAATKLNYRSAETALGVLYGVNSTTVTVNGKLDQAKQIRSALQAGSPVVVGTKDSTSRYLNGANGIVANHAYTVIGIEIPSNGDLKKTYISLRNPWGIDAELQQFDANGDGKISDVERDKWGTGLDGANDGLLRVPWSVFSESFDHTTIANYTGPDINSPLPINQLVKFTTPNLGTFTVFEGQTLKVNLKAVDPEGRFVYYTLLSKLGSVHPQTGVFSWEPPATTAGKSFTVRVKADTNGKDAATVAFLVKVVSAKPVITSLQVSPGSIKQDGSERLTLTAKGVSTITGKIDHVEFWRDADNNGSFNPQIDVFLGNGLQSGTDWAWSGYVGGLSYGSQTFFTRAVRYSYTDEFWSATRAVSVTTTPGDFVTPVAVTNQTQTRVPSPLSGMEVLDRTQDDAGNSYYLLLQKIQVSPAPNPQFVSFLNIAKYNSEGVSRGVHNLGLAPGLWKFVANANGTSAIIFQSGNDLYAVTLSDTLAVVASGKVYAGPKTDEVIERIEAVSDATGNMMIAFHKGGYFQEDIYALSVARDLTVKKAAWRVNGHTASMQKYPTLAMNSKGEGVIAWSDFDQNKVIARRVTGYGQTAGGEFVVANWAQADTEIGSAIRENGEFTIAWPQSVSADAESLGIFLQNYNASGEATGGVVRASTFRSGSFFRPRIAFHSSGWMVVGWDNNNKPVGGAVNDYGAFAQVFDGNGLKVGPEFALPSTVEGNQFLKELKFRESGEITAFWNHSQLSSSPISEYFSRRWTVDFAPAFSGMTSFTLPENSVAGTLVGTVQGFDYNPGSTLTYEILGDSPFVIEATTGQVRVKPGSVLDYERDPRIPVSVLVTSVSPVVVPVKKTAVTTLTVNLTDLNEAPTLSTTTTTFSYFSGEQLLLGLGIELTDQDNRSFLGGILSVAITASPGSTDRLSLSPTLGVQVSQDGLLTVNSVEIGHVISIGSATSPLSIEFNENATRILVEVVLRSLQFSIQAQSFSRATRSITVSLTDGSGGDSNPLVFSVTPSPLILPGVISVPESTAKGKVIATLTVPGRVLTSPAYTLISGEGSEDNSQFTISKDQLKTKNPLDFEKKRTYSIRVQVKDKSGQIVQEVLTINVTDVNEKPTALVLSKTSIAEQNAIGAVIGNLSTTDPDAGETFTYSLVGSSKDNAFFKIVGNQLIANTAFDFEARKKYSITIRTSDQGGLFLDKTFSITITDVNEAPTDIKLSKTGVKENAKSGTTIGSLSAVDVDGKSPRFTLVSGEGSADNAFFTVTGTTLKTNAIFDFELRSAYSIRVQVTDAGGLSYEKIFLITIVDVVGK
ncbi:C2 family cysteine protease [Planctomicrobium sp. SH664]|uniref:C2 family cysteine protease n=1 Tax=Planctomicrobium sp. SH664 TaxID=3448125 RepID=UPI003F5AF82E